MREENRHYRRKIKQRFYDIDNCEDAIADIRLKKCKKLLWEIKTVRERVQTQLDQRCRRQIANCFWQPYNSQVHRQEFIRFLSLITQSKSSQAQKTAWQMRDWLYPSASDYFYQCNYRRHKWLQEFFKDQPEWELRLKKWTNLMSYLKY